MKTVTLEVITPQDAMNDLLQVWKTGEKEETTKISFASPEILWKVLTAKRWELLKALCGAGPISIREAARRVNRDVKGVHTDLTALMLAGIVNRTETGGVEFPFEAVKVEFFLKVA
ncbi:DNA-binding protein [Thioflexithrix psekupsensis]|uniref:DNA-binding protein n=1 Tax=Thioflexithrix psekupsensis TaxID=1570016 RepID=A0A251X5F3_9GAMM|nr:DNA-binding protein [Thioflexithrix psekupsensis]OUD12167.1 DNA-binding protein [Thioflexithrix psekupsensis]